MESREGESKGENKDRDILPKIAMSGEANNNNDNQTDSKMYKSSTEMSFTSCQQLSPTAERFSANNEPLSTTAEEAEGEEQVFYEATTKHSR